jgi:hypothetical protein
MSIYELVVMFAEHLKEGISGVAGTFLAWFFFFIVMAPRIRFPMKLKPVGKHLATDLPGHHDRLRVGLANRSFSLLGLLKHDVYDVRIHARLQFRETLEAHTNSEVSEGLGGRLVYFDVPFENGEITYEIPVLKANYKSFLYIGLLHRDIKKLAYGSLFPETGKSEIGLLDIMGLRAAVLTIVVSVRDKFTGNEKTFIQEYKLAENKKEVVRVDA